MGVMTIIFLFIVYLYVIMYKFIRFWYSLVMDGWEYMFSIKNSSLNNVTVLWELSGGDYLFVLLGKKHSIMNIESIEYFNLLFFIYIYI